MELLKQINLYNLIRLIIIIVMLVLVPFMIFEKALKKVKSAFRKILTAFNFIK